MKTSDLIALLSRDRRGAIRLRGARGGDPRDPLAPLTAGRPPRDYVSCGFREGGDDCFPLKPQRILRDLRAAMGREDILISDVSSHKLLRPARHLVYPIRGQSKGRPAARDLLSMRACERCGRSSGAPGSSGTRTTA
jgi:hypothetical protein